MVPSSGFVVWTICHAYTCDSAAVQGAVGHDSEEFQRIGEVLQHGLLAGLSRNTGGIRTELNSI
eukprot:4371777-Amphidinium_carterae.1